MTQYLFTRTLSRAMSSVAMHWAFCGFRVQLCFRACELPSKCPVSGGDGAPRTTCRLFDFWKMNWHYLFGSSVSDCPIGPLSSPRSLLHNSTHGKRLAEHVVSQDGASVQGDALQAGCDGCQEVGRGRLRRPPALVEASWSPGLLPSLAIP